MKLRQALVLLTATLMLAVVLPACKKDKKGNAEPAEVAGKIPGLGDTPGTPAATAYELPANISLVGKIKGNVCDTAYERGSGRFVDVCVALINSGGTDITLTIPAGLIILADSEEDQHGMIIQETTIILKAGKITRCGLNAYCTNASKHPSSYTSTYTIGGVSSSVLIKQLIAILKNKKVNTEDYPNDREGYGKAEDAVQGAVWGITDGDGLNDIVKQELAEIPNK